MLNSRCIRPDMWEHARQSLIFFFSRRHGVNQAEDLAQETLMTLWNREDYQFAREEEFLRVCYGFAGRILQQGYRQTQKHAGAELDPAAAEPVSELHGLEGIEIGIFLEEVRRIGKLELQDREWQLIRDAAAAPERGRASEDRSSSEANNERVRLHRARKKLARLTGWRVL